MDGMRILVTGFTANYGGVENFIMNYYRVMKRLDDTVVIDIISTAVKPAFQEEIEGMGGRVWRISRNRYKWKQKREIKEVLQNNKYDVLWCNKCELAEIIALQEAYYAKIPVRILHSHNSDNMHKGIRNWMVSFVHGKNKYRVSKFATEFWACSAYAAKWMFMKKVIENQYKFIPNMIDSNKFRYNEEVRLEVRSNLQVEKNVVVGCVGRFSKQKNPLFTLEIFKEIAKLLPTAKLVWIGIGELFEVIQEKIVEYHLEDSVQLLGERQDVCELMQGMDYLLLPSLFEGLPVVAIEAQAAGLPVIAAEEGISKETKITKYMMFLSLNDTAKKWAEVIVALDLKHSDTYEEICRKGFDCQYAGKILLDNLYKLRKSKL